MHTRGPDSAKVQAIREILREHPEGITVTDIFKESQKKKYKLKYATTWFYVNKHMRSGLKVVAEIGNKNKKAVILYAIK